MKTKLTGGPGKLYEEPWARWWKLVKLYWVENSRQYILALLAIGGLMLLAFSLSFFTKGSKPMNPGFQALFYLVGLYFVGCLYGSLIFSELNRKREAIQYLLLPASHLEKLFCGLFFGVFLFFIVYNALFYLLDIPLVKLENSINWKIYLASKEPLSQYSPLEVFSPMEFKGHKQGEGYNNESIILLLLYFSIQSAYILGSVYFTRYNFIKTTIVLLLLGFACFLFFDNIFGRSLPTGISSKGLFRWGFNDPETNRPRWVLLSPGVESILLFVVEWSWPFLLWLVTFLRLREKQVQG